MTKISTLSDQPFSLSPKNVIFRVIIMKFLIPGQNFGIFASSIKGMDTFLFEMSMKWMFTFKNFRNVYWHGKTHSAMVEPSSNILPNGRRTKICKVCRKEGRAQAIIDHIEAHHLEGMSLPCDFCGKEFRSRLTLRRHTCIPKWVEN